MKTEHITTRHWHIGAPYTRADMASTGLVTAPLGGRDPHWSTGIVQFSNAVLLLVTLEKDAYTYVDYFDGPRFWWQSQNQQTPSSPVIQKLSNGVLQAHLFVRLRAKHKGKTLPFVYCGPLSTPIFEGSQPVTGLFHALAYSAKPTSALAQIYDWRPPAQATTDNQTRMQDLLQRHAQTYTATAPVTTALAVQEATPTYAASSEPVPLSEADMYEARKRIAASVVRRQGQPAFRQALLKAYAGQCAVTGCAVVPVLEAAHIYPYRGEHTNLLSNGLLLRADIHTLFDQFLLSVNPLTRTICVAPSLSSSPYAQLHGRPLATPIADCEAPSEFALRWHKSQCDW